VCYKPIMRKWMRERMKRRKTATPKENQPAEASQAPLQPAYFDAHQMGASDQAPSETPEESAPQVDAAEPAAESAAPARSAAPEAPARRRRRRGRGGRGRSGASSTGQPTLQPMAVAPDSSQLQPAPQASPAPASSAAETTPRKPKGVVVLAIGLPGSGKSSWFKRHKINPLSSDTLRQLLFDDPTEQRFQDLVFSNLRSMLKARLIARRPMNYVDATNLSTHDRQGWIKMARDFGYEVHGVFFDVPVEVCLERNQRRDRVVPEDVMRRMASKLRPPNFDEGFAKITIVRVKKKEGGPVE
jgi:predicted kinase